MISGVLVFGYLCRWSECVMTLQTDGIKKRAWFTVYPARLRLGVESHKSQSYLSICIPWNGVEDPERGKSHREVHLISWVLHSSYKTSQGEESIAFMTTTTKICFLLWFCREGILPKMTETVTASPFGTWKADRGKAQDTSDHLDPGEKPKCFIKEELSHACFLNPAKYLLSSVIDRLFSWTLSC